MNKVSDCRRTKQFPFDSRLCICRQQEGSPGFSFVFALGANDSNEFICTLFHDCLYVFHSHKCFSSASSIFFIRRFARRRCNGTISELQMGIEKQVSLTFTNDILPQYFTFYVIVETKNYCTE